MIKCTPTDSSSLHVGIAATNVNVTDVDAQEPRFAITLAVYSWPDVKFNNSTRLPLVVSIIVTLLLDITVTLKLMTILHIDLEIDVHSITTPLVVLLAVTDIGGSDKR